MLAFAVLVVILINFTCAESGGFCPLVCKNPGNSSGHGSGSSSSTIVYISQSETVIGFYDSSTQYAFLLDWKTQYLLIINVKSDASAIFSWSTGTGYYISSSVKATLIYSGSGSRESVVAYFKSITSLREVFNVYRKYGKSFSFNQLEGQAKVIIEGFLSATFPSTQQASFISNGIKQWASFASVIYTGFSKSLSGFGIFEIYASGEEIIEFLLQHDRDGGNNFSGQSLQDFLKILRELGGNNNGHFNDNIEKLLQSIGIRQSSPELIGFLRFIELLSSINTTAASNASPNTPLTQFLLPNSAFTAHDFEAILRSTPGLEHFLRIFIQFGYNWTAIFRSNSSGWGQICTNIPGLQQFIEFARQNPGFAGFLKVGEAFADGVKSFARGVAVLANSFPIPNPFAPVISGFAGGVEGVASQVGNGLHLVDGIFGGSGSNESRKKV